MKATPFCHNVDDDEDDGGDSIYFPAMAFTKKELVRLCL